MTKNIQNLIDAYEAAITTYAIASDRLEAIRGTIHLTADIHTRIVQAHKETRDDAKEAMVDARCDLTQAIHNLRVK